MKNVYVLTGLPASGKSTWTEKFLKSVPGNTHVYSTDNYLEDRIDGVTVRDYNEAFNLFIKQAAHFVELDLEKMIGVSDHIILDQTNLSVKKRKSQIEKIKKLCNGDCCFAAICFVPPRNNEEWDILESRLNSRVGKDIPKHIINNMVSSYQEPTIDEGYLFINFEYLDGSFDRKMAV